MTQKSRDKLYVQSEATQKPAMEKKSALAARSVYKRRLLSFFFWNTGENQPHKLQQNRREQSQRIEVKNSYSKERTREPESQRRRRRRRRGANAKAEGFREHN